MTRHLREHQLREVVRYAWADIDAAAPAIGIQATAQAMPIRNARPMRAAHFSIVASVGYCFLRMYRFPESSR